MDSPEQIQQEAHIQVIAKNLYQDSNREPIPFGVLDRKMVNILKYHFNDHSYHPSLILGCKPEKRQLRNLFPRAQRMHRPLWISGLGTAGVSRRAFPCDHIHSADDLQDLFQCHDEGGGQAELLEASYESGNFVLG